MFLSLPFFSKTHYLEERVDGKSDGQMFGYLYIDTSSTGLAMHNA
jgi:hypothetical protein